MNIPPEKLEICLEVLQQVSEDPAVMSAHDRFKGLIAKIHREGKKGERRLSQQRSQKEDRALRAKSVMVNVQKGGTSATGQEDVAETVGELTKPSPCYICKRLYSNIHFFYHLLCPTCAALNYAKRSQCADLTGRTALITGGRIKIGYQAALRLLRDGARVIITTRFPRDCARRFGEEKDFQQWQDRLQIYGLDLRNLPAVEEFACYLLETEPALDILIHNAAQTIKRPIEFYRHLLEQEQIPLSELPANHRALLPAESASHLLLESDPRYRALQFDTSAYFPPDTFDGDGQQLDLRPITSWLLKLDEVSPVEMLEVQLVNAVAPFLLNSQLKALLMRSPFARRFVINVSAMEGQFNRESKTIYHPHTNMAKAALNMMTRTSATDYARDGIYMNSVDTGWITNENPYEIKTRLQKADVFFTPLDVMDGMARIYDPIVRGIREPEEPLYGHFLKDYAPHPW